MGGDSVSPGALGSFDPVSPILGLGKCSDGPGILGARQASALLSASRSRWRLGFAGSNAAWGEQYSLSLSCGVCAGVGFKDPSENQAGP